MHIARAMRVLGYVLLALVCMPEVLDPKGLPWGRYLLGWAIAYVVFGVAFHVGASAPETAYGRRLAALGVMTPAMLAMAAILPCHFGSLALVVVASQAALILSPGSAAVWIALQTAGVGTCMLCSGDKLQDTLGNSVALLGFQGFAAVCVYLARREAEAKGALARTNAELVATRSLLEETSRVHERNRIARELHDVLGHDLTALGLQLEVATHVAPASSTATR